MKTSDFFYDLPDNCIAQSPVEPRDSSKLLVLNRSNGNISHFHFYDIVNMLNDNDVLVVNRSKVIPARLFCHRKNKVETLEVLLLKKIEMNKYEAIVKPGKKFKLGTELVFSSNLSGIVSDITDSGERIIDFTVLDQTLLENELNNIGEMPLPPYIKQKLVDQGRYQTVYAKEEGSSAAPTAGLHFTNELLNKLREKNVQIEEVILHVGLGTFRPVKVEDVTKHVMHSEDYLISQDTAHRLNAAKQSGKNIIAVGTTTVRVLETVATKEGILKAGSGSTNIFIYPPYKFKFVDELITNFHLPESTLLMLVSAFAGKDYIFSAYKNAIENGYRFFSFGDAMFIRGDNNE